MPRATSARDPHDTHQRGLRGEALARQAAEARGWQIAGHRERMAIEDGHGNEREGEADLLATRRDEDGVPQALVAEVKTTRDGDLDELYERVCAKRQGHLWKLAASWLFRVRADEVHAAIILVRLPQGRGEPEIHWIELDHNDRLR